MTGRIDDVHNCSSSALFHPLQSNFTKKLIFYRDRFRTMTNVVGDSIGAGIVYHLSKSELSAHQEDKTENLNLVRVDIPNGKEAITAV